MRTTTQVQWPHRSQEDELEAIRWYLTGRLDIGTKLDPALGDAVTAYEYIRHAATVPGYPDWKKPERKDQGALALTFTPDIAEILLADGFPELPFCRLSRQTQVAISSWFDYDKDCAARCCDMRFLFNLGVFHRFIDQAKTIPVIAPYVPAVMECGPGLSVVCLMFSHDHGPAAVQRGFKHWLRTGGRQFMKGGRRTAGQRTKDYHWSKVKDLAAARLLAFHGFDFANANNWAERNQPRDTDRKRFAWSGKKGRNSSGPLFETPRDARRLLTRFEKTLRIFSAAANEVIDNLQISDFVMEVIAKAENTHVFGLQKRPPCVH